MRSSNSCSSSSRLDPIGRLTADPPADRLNALAGGVPLAVGRIREEIGRGSGAEVVQGRATQIYPQTVKTEEDLEALLNAIRSAAEEALGTGKYFQIL